MSASRLGFRSRAAHNRTRQTGALLDALDETDACVMDQLDAIQAVAAVEQAIRAVGVSDLKLETRNTKLAAHFQQSSRSLRPLIRPSAKTPFAPATTASPHNVNRCACAAEESSRFPNRALVTAGMPTRITIKRNVFRHWISRRDIIRGKVDTPSLPVAEQLPLALTGE